MYIKSLIVQETNVAENPKAVTTSSCDIWVLISSMSHQPLKKHRLAAITGKIDPDSDEEKDISTDAHFDSHGNADVLYRIYSTRTVSTNQTSGTSTLTPSQTDVAGHKSASEVPDEKEKRKQVCITA
jgi:hypothetical protein